MACFITFGKMNLRYIVYPIVNIIFLIIYNYFKYKTSLLQNLSNHPIIEMINSSLGNSLLLIAYIILKVRDRYDRNSASLEGKLKYNEEYLKTIKKMKPKKYLLILIVSLSGYGYAGLYYIFDINDVKYFSLWIFDVIYICILSYFILHLKIYKHQYFSIIIIILLGIIFNIINASYKDIKLINIIVIFFAEMLFSLNIVISKYSMDNLFCSPLELLFYPYIFILVISIIVLIVSTNNENKDGEVEYKGKKYLDNFYDYIDKINIKEIFIFLFALIYNLIINLFTLLTIKYYTIYHISTILIFDEGDYFSYGFTDWKLYIIIIIYILFIFMTLVFNEIIELNFFGLEKNLRRNIMQRADNNEMIDTINDEKIISESPMIEIDNNYLYKLDNNNEDE